MDKLDYKDLIGYLRYNLKGVVMYEFGKEICTLDYTSGINNRCDIHEFVNGEYKVMPILKPLSSLDIPLVWQSVAHKERNCDVINSICDITINGNFYIVKKFFDFLYSEHYDVHDLIPRKLALSKKEADALINNIEN